jgi:hypothetical protein
MGRGCCDEIADDSCRKHECCLGVGYGVVSFDLRCSHFVSELLTVSREVLCLAYIWKDSLKECQHDLPEFLGTSVVTPTAAIAMPLSKKLMAVAASLARYPSDVTTPTLTRIGLLPASTLPSSTLPSSESLSMGIDGRRG